MRLQYLRIRGITEAFPNEVCVDFDSLGEGLIAIVGENGAGKSTLIGSIFAALCSASCPAKSVHFMTSPPMRSQKSTSLSASTVLATGRFSRSIPSLARWRVTCSTGTGNRLPTAKRSPLRSLSVNALARPTSSSAASSPARSGRGIFSRWIGASGKNCSSESCSGLDRLRLIAARGQREGRGSGQDNAWSGWPGEKPEGVGGGRC